MTGACPAGTGLSPTVEPVPVSPPDGASIPSAVIEQFCADVQGPLENIVKKFCKQAYETILGDVQFYLIENSVFNIGNKFDSQQRETVTAYKVLLAVEDATTLQEAKRNAYAARRGYWSEERAAEYRAQAGEAGTAETGTGSVHEHAVAESDAPESPTP